MGREEARLQCEVIGREGSFTVRHSGVIHRATPAREMENLASQLLTLNVQCVLK